MKTLIWTLFTVLSLLWTGLAWALTQLAGWLSDAWRSGRTQDWAQLLEAWEVPGWLGVWLDTRALEALRSGLLWVLEHLGAVLPSMGTVMDWLTPLIWLSWALVQGLMLVLAGLIHAVVRDHRLQAPAPANR